MLRGYRTGQPHLGAAALLFGGFFTSCLLGVAAFFTSCLFWKSMSGATDFGNFLDFRCLFRFLPVVKATDFAGFPFFRCLFHFLPARKASDFAGFSFFRCLLATILTQEIFNSSFLFSHTINGLMHFLKKLVVAQVSIRHFAEPHQYEIVTYFLYKPARFVLRIPESPNLLPPLKYH